MQTPVNFHNFIYQDSSVPTGDFGENTEPTPPIPENPSQLTMTNKWLDDSAIIFFVSTQETIGT